MYKDLSTEKLVGIWKENMCLTEIQGSHDVQDILDANGAEVELERRNYSMDKLETWLTKEKAASTVCRTCNNRKTKCCEDCGYIAKTEGK